MEKEEKIFVTTGSFISTSSFLQEDRHVNTPGAAYLKKKGFLQCHHLYQPVSRE